MSWTLKDRLDANGHNVIRPWLDDQPLKARLKIDQILRNLAVCDRLGLPFVKKIKGHDGVYEIVAKHDKVQYRPLGGYGPHQGEFTLVLGAIEHNNNIRPPNAFTTAAGFVLALKEDRCRVCDHEYEEPHPSPLDRAER